MVHGKSSQYQHYREFRERLILTLTGSAKGLKTSAAEVTADVLGAAWARGLGVGPADAPEPRRHGQALTADTLLLMHEQRKRFLDREPTPGEDTVKITELTTKDSEYYMNLADKAFAGCARTDSDFERRSTVSKMLPTSIACHRETVVKGRVDHSQLHRCLILRHFHNLQQPPPGSVISYQYHQGETLRWLKGYDSQEVRRWLVLFSNKALFN